MSTCLSVPVCACACVCLHASVYLCVYLHLSESAYVFVWVHGCMFLSQQCMVYNSHYQEQLKQTHHMGYSLKTSLWTDQMTSVWKITNTQSMHGKCNRLLSSVFQHSNIGIHLSQYKVCSKKNEKNIHEYSYQSYKKTYSKCLDNQVKNQSCIPHSHAELKLWSAISNSR